MVRLRPPWAIYVGRLSGAGSEGAYGYVYVLTSKYQCLWKSELVVFKGAPHPPTFHGPLDHSRVKWTPLAFPSASTHPLPSSQPLEMEESPGALSC